jgi:hypothetical protein
MNYLSILWDERINSFNISFEIEINTYLELSKEIIKNNEFQRRRVKSSSSVYALLREDLNKGCVIPPLVLALSRLEQMPDIHEDTFKYPDLMNLMKDNVNRLMIIDGLQRTYTIFDLEDELKAKNDEQALANLYKHKIRVELYIGINRIGILYRMLTLNTGQTPMSLRHQIEILYSDYLNHQVEGISLLREIDEARAVKTEEYNFRDVIEGFNSYLERNELPIDKLSLLENVKGLEKLAAENQDIDLFKSFLVTFHKLVLRINSVSGNWRFDETEMALRGPAFGTTIESVFKRAQVLTGFGAAIGRLKDRGIIDDFADIKIDEIDVEAGETEWLNNLLRKLDAIRNEAKKIGNAQRMFFQYFFRELFNPETDSYPHLNKAVDNGYQKYLSQTM